MNGLKRRLGEAKGKWAEELMHIVWAVRTTEKVATGRSAYSLVYGMEAVIPAEIGLPTRRTMTVEVGENEAKIKESLDLVEEIRDEASVQNERYRQAMVRYHNARVRSCRFQEGDLVLRKNEVSRVLKP